MGPVPVKKIPAFMMHLLFSRPTASDIDSHLIESFARRKSHQISVPDAGEEQVGSDRLTKDKFQMLPKK
jgi:hypothetical protein